MSRDPRSVPDDGPPPCADVTDDLDTDGDGTADSIFGESPAGDLLLHVDLDADGLADRTFALRADGTTDVHDCDDEPPSLVDVLLRLLPRWP